MRPLPEPPENAVVWSVDEKSQVPATSRVNPTLPAVPGIPVRRDYGYHDLADRIVAFINDYNRRAAPFRWTYDGRFLMAA